MSKELSSEMFDIKNIKDPRIAPYVTLRSGLDPLLRQASGLDADAVYCVAEGVKVVKSLLESELEVVSFFALPEYHETFAVLLDKKSVETRLSAGSDIMDQIVGYRMHQGVMALGRAPAPLSLGQVHGPVVALNGLCNAENVGAIVRNCVAFGVKQILVDDATASPYLRRAIKTSMGAAFSVAVHQSSDLAASLHTLKSNKGYSIIGADLCDDAIALSELCFPDSCVLVIGSEGHGLDSSVRAACDTFVKIPIQPAVESLNAAAATAILLHQLTWNVVSEL